MIDDERAEDAPAIPALSPVVELRQYTVRPGRRETLVELFDREFVESQEALGMRIIGQFRDLDAPDRFVWLRGFADMDSRRAGLGAFYGGPVWAAHGAAANATMLDSDDVLLLRPAGPGTRIVGTPRSRPRPGSDGRPDPISTLVTVTVYPVATAAEEDALLAFLHTGADPVQAAAGRRPVAEMRTLGAANTFPALPIREDDHVVVRLARYGSPADHAAYVDRLRRSPAWRDGILPALRRRLTRPAQHLRLQPTPRSGLR